VNKQYIPTRSACRRRPPGPWPCLICCIGGTELPENVSTVCRLKVWSAAGYSSEALAQLHRTMQSPGNRKSARRIGCFDDSIRPRTNRHAARLPHAYDFLQEFYGLSLTSRTFVSTSAAVHRTYPRCGRSKPITVPSNRKMVRLVLFLLALRRLTSLTREV
jgi:hypothetical protein